MRGHHHNNNNNNTAIFLFIPFLLLVTVTASAPEFHLQDDDDNGDFIVKQQSSFSRRILHQPLFPASSSPPSLPPPPPPPPPDQPFFPEVPQGGTTPTPISDQSPPPQPINGTAAVSVTHPVPIQPQETTPVKKVAIALSVGIVTLGMLSALAFYICKHRVKHADESQKLVASGTGNGNGGTISQDMSEESRLPPSTFLYIGTVEPSAQRILTENNDANASPYRKLNSFKRNDRSYRPSPDLQPLPPLTKPPPPPPPLINSPPPMSSSDEENTFYTPHGSSEGTSGSRRRTSIPHSKRTSPKSRLSFSSSDAQKPIAPPVKNLAPPPPPPPPPRLVPPISIRPKLSASMINNHQTPSSKAVKPQVRSPTHSPPQKTNSIEKIGIVKEVSNSSSDRNDGDDIDGSRPKLKPLHWDKVRATSNRATVWDQLKSSSFQLNEDMMESLFGCNAVNMVPKEAKRKPVLPPVEQENRVLDPKKSQNIAILLRALNVTREEVSEALLDGNPEGLGQELLETLVKMAPTKEEEIKLKNYNGDASRLGSAERFLKAILDIPFAFKRVEAMLYRANFDAEVNYLRKSFQTLEEASVELKNSRLFLKILDAVLRTGNRMNVGTNRGDARAFKLETLLKLADVKGADGKTTLLHFVVQEIIRSEEASTGDLTNKPFSGVNDDEFRRRGLQVVGGLSKELGNVKRAAAMDADVLSSYVSKLKKGLEKVTMVLQYEKTSMEGKFFESMKQFVKEAEEEIRRVMAEEQAALSSVKEVTEYFHGNAAKEEAHPYRIFMIVRDFLSILDNVCKEVGKMHDHSMVVGTGRSFRIPANASLPVLNRYNVKQDGSSDEGLSP